MMMTKKTTYQENGYQDDLRHWPMMMTKKTTYLYDDQGPGDRRPLASVGELKSEISAVALDLVASV